MGKLTIVDSRNKTWECDVTIDGRVIVLEPKGYNKTWPFILQKDKIFLNNVVQELKKMGMKKNVRQYNKETEDTIQFIGDGAVELNSIFKKKSKPNFKDVFKY
jgi:hypothetical protein